jgi:hypothetical protein
MMRRVLALIVPSMVVVACSTTYQAPGADGGSASGSADASVEDATTADGSVANDAEATGDSAATSSDAGGNVGDAAHPALDASGLNCPVMCTCSGSDSCTFTAGDGAQITCTGQSDCTVSCSGTCTVTCAESADCYCPSNVTCVEQGSAATCHKI